MINNGSKYFIILLLFIYVKIFGLIYKVGKNLLVNFVYIMFDEIYLYLHPLIKIIILRIIIMYDKIYKFFFLNLCF